MQAKKKRNHIACCRMAESELHDTLCGLDHEESWAIFLTHDNTVIGKEMLTKGTLTKTVIDCRTVLRRALLNNACSVILLHNHPSGDPKPSRPDISFTERLHNACELMDISLMDHIIVSEESFYSFSDDKVYQYI